MPEIACGMAFALEATMQRLSFSVGLLTFALFGPGCSLLAFDDLSSGYGTGDPKENARDDGGASRQTSSSDPTLPTAPAQPPAEETTPASGAPTADAAAPYDPLAPDPGCTMSPFAASTASNVGGTTFAWTAPDNARAADGADAEVHLAGSGTLSGALVLSGFNASVPANAKVVGMLVKVVRHSAGCVFDHSITLGIGGAPRSSPTALGKWTGTQLFGGLHALWGGTAPTNGELAASSVNVTLVASFQGTCGNSRAGIDAVTLYVHHCPN